MAVLEAMAAGIPVVSTKHAGIPDAVQHGSTGLLSDEGDVEAAAAAISELSCDRKLNERFGTAGWRRAKELFSWQVERRRLLDLMEIGPAQKGEGT